MDRFTNDIGGRHGYESSGRSSISDREYRGTSVCSNGRKMRRNVVRCPTPEPIVRRVVERAPTPEPDIIERVVVKPAPQTIVERIIERPATPEARIITREVIESPQPAIVRTRVVKVGSRSSSRFGNRSYIPGNSTRLTRYDDYFEDDPCNRYRSHSSYRSRPISRYDNHVSRSSSRHSAHHSILPMSRSQSFDVINVPGASKGHSRPNSVYSGHQQMMQPSAPPMDSHAFSQYTQDKYTGNIIGPSPMQQSVQMSSNMYPQIQRIYPNPAFLDGQGGLQQFGYQQAYQQPQYPQVAAGYNNFQYQQAPKSYSPANTMMNMFPQPPHQHQQPNNSMMSAYGQQPNVINLPPVQLSYGDLQYLGIPYPSY